MCRSLRLTISSYCVNGRMKFSRISPSCGGRAPLPLLFFTQISLNSLKTLCLSPHFRTENDIREKINGSHLSLRRDTQLILKSKKKAQSSSSSSRHSRVKRKKPAAETEAVSVDPEAQRGFRCSRSARVGLSAGTGAGQKWVGSLKQRGKSLAVREEKTDCLTHSRLFLLHSQLSLTAALRPKEHGNIF